MNTDINLIPSHPLIPLKKGTEMISQSSKYAIRAALYLTTHTENDEKIGASEMAEEMDIPSAFLSKILQKLSKSGIVSSKKGPGGGFYMTQENKKKTLIEIIHSIEGSQIFKSCILGLPVCSDKNPCPLHRSLVVFRDGFYSQLKNQSIEELGVRMEFNNYQI